MASEKPEDSDTSSTHARLYQFKLRPLACRLGRVIISILASCLICCPRSLRPASTKRPHELHPTAYLDALRGYAAWIVYNYHIIPGKWRQGVLFTQWPFSILFNGNAMVDLFFVISGFALSYSILGHMHNNQPLRVLNSLASSVFRRYLRLYLPTIWASFMTMLAISSGVAAKNGLLQPTFTENVWYWIKDTTRSCSPFHNVVSWRSKGDGHTHTSYLPQSWTIPVELKGSLLVFLFCVAVCRMTTRARMWITLVSSFASFWWTTPYAGLFLFGMWLADRRHLRMRNQQNAADCLPSAQPASEATVPQSEPHAPTTFTIEPRDNGDNSERWSQLLRFRGKFGSWRTNKTPTVRQQMPFLVIAILSSWPLTAPAAFGPKSPFPYNAMATTLPPYWRGNRKEAHWPYSVGAMMLCYALDRTPLLQKPFNSSFSQYIGELSFGIYMMHNLVREIVWDRFLMVWARTYLGESPRYQLPGYLVLTVLVLWAAEVFRRVDVKCVQLTKRLQDLFFER